MPPRVAARMAATTAGARGKQGGKASGPGFLQRLVLWGVASALIGFTFWPLLGSGPIREAVFGPFTSLSGASAQVATGAGGTGGARAPR